MPRLPLAIFAACLTLACGSPEAPAPAARLVFLRGAVLAPAGAGGRPVQGGRELVPEAWRPGELTTAGGRTDPAPAAPECVPLFSADLGDVRSLVAMGGSEPNTALAWSPDGESLAVGSYLGEVLVLDGWTGAIRARRGLAETMVKQVAWSADGATVYAVEQSPDALVHALAATDLSESWTKRLADDLETSPAPAATDIFGVYALPAAYALEVLGDGSLFVAGIHGWDLPDGSRRNLSRAYRLGPDGAVLAAWPPLSERPADATLLHPAVDERGGLVALPIGRSASGPAPPELPIGGVLVLDLATLTPHASFRSEPLRPYFDKTFVWEAIDVDGEAGVVLEGLSDGRARLRSLDPARPDLLLELGTPILSGDVPVAASIGWGSFVPGGFVVNTGPSNIPWTSRSAAARPEAPHPSANTLWMHGLDGAPRWTWRGEHEIQGLTVSPGRTRLVVGAGSRKTDQRRDLYGALVFRLEGEGSGDDRLEAFCPTEGPVFFHHAVTNDGRVAVSEVPYLDEAGAVQGAYRATVLR